MSHTHEHKNHTCNAHCTASSVCQTLDELEFERGIWCAAQNGEIERVKRLLKSGNEAERRDAAGYTALHYAARNGHLEVCKLLIDNGANVNSTTRAGNASALHRASSAGKVSIVKFLLENGANLELKDGDGKTALHRASDIQNIEICKLILELCPSLRKMKDFKDKLPADYAKNENLKNLLNAS